MLCLLYGNFTSFSLLAFDKSVWVQDIFSNLLHSWVKHLLPIPTTVVSYHFPGTSSTVGLIYQKGGHSSASIRLVWVPVLVNLPRQLLQKPLMCHDKVILHWDRQGIPINSFNNPVPSNLGATQS